MPKLLIPYASAVTNYIKQTQFSLLFRNKCLINTSGVQVRYVESDLDSCFGFDKFDASLDYAALIYLCKKMTETQKPPTMQL